MNHTSSDHPWFQASRAERDGPYGDWYVWSDSDEPWQEARIIFLDTGAVELDVDPVRGQYFWHRFFSHQPDLNYDNPEACGEAMLDVLRFWLDLGIDGFRMDAIPYLYERDGTNGENLPESHDYPRSACARRSTRTMRTRCSSPRRTSGLRTSSTATATSATCASTSRHAAHVHVAAARVDATPIYEILERTPPIPENCQWVSSCGPRRADARDGHRRRARLHVHRVREGSAHEAQPRDPPAPRAAARRAADESSSCTRSCSRCRAHRSLLRGRDRDGRQHLPRRPDGGDADAVDGDRNGGFSRADFASSTCRR